jgi:hypothetical protein
MPDMLQTAIGQQTGRYPYGPFTGATVSKAAAPITDPKDPNYAYQFDLPGWLQNAIYASQIPARMMTWSSPANLLHKVVGPASEMMWTGSPFDPGQAPSWVPRGFQPRTDPVTNALRGAGKLQDLAGEQVLMQFAAPEQLAMGSTFKWPPRPTGTIPHPEELGMPNPADLWYTAAKRIPEEVNRRGKRLLDEARAAGDMEEFDRLLKRYPEVWKKGQAAYQDWVWKYANARAEAALREKATRALAGGTKEEMKEAADAMERAIAWKQGPIRPIPTAPTKFRNFVRPGAMQPAPSGPPVGVPPAFWTRWSR